MIRLGAVGVDSLEGIQLLRAGVSPATIETGNLTRNQLLDAGFAFLNMIGGGEKPLITATIEMEDGSIVDTGQRRLLTDTELNTVQRLYGSRDTASNEQTRLAMIDFFQMSKESIRLLPQTKATIFSEAQRKILESGNEEHILLISRLFQSIVTSDSGHELAFMIDNCLAKLDIVKVGGIPVDMYASRSGILQGAPSPFLDSGYHFDTNDDVTIYPDDPTRTRRLNSVVVHLLSRGVNEVGSSDNGSHDQTYITDGEFREMMTSVDESRHDNEVVETFITRLLEKARQNDAS